MAQICSGGNILSQRLINTYLAEIHRLKQYGGTSTEEVIREAFKDLLKNWSRAGNLVFIPELPFQTNLGTTVKPDGTILHDVRVPLGYWEAKDTSDDLDEEIAKKRLKGYPQDNIIYENSETAVLWQNRVEVMRCRMTDVETLERLLNLFFGYQRPEIAQFRRAVEQFKTDLPAVLAALRDKIDDAYADNAGFQAIAAKFLEHAKNTINPGLERADIREMLIQHILTEEIFARVFDEADFHRDNNIARLLYGLEAAFFTGEVKKSTLRALQPYYTAIHANAAQITSHTEKQTFLKVIYENFYKVYNPDAADRLGVVYTPNEIVRFMIEGTDWLCEKHFGKRLIDEGVEILDPATGTGTYICELIEYFRGQPAKLRRKYTEELHANEVAILPYYVANLNIEATYQAVAGQYAEYPNLCFVDTLDNIAGLGVRRGQTPDLFASFSDENVERVNRQNRRKISVVIGNPPYNAWQENYNKRNANRKYKKMDQRIKETYVARGTSQNQNSVYDMYTRFFRWASDRVHDDGIICFITGRKPFAKMAYDGFRAEIFSEFNEIYVVDLGGDVVDNPKLSGTKHNVFGIKVGVAVSFLVKRHGAKGCKVFYARRPEDDTAEDKLAWLSAESLHSLRMDRVEPDRRHIWIDQSVNDWDDLLPLADKDVKAGKRGAKGAIFKTFSRGVATQRDEWVYDASSASLGAKVGYLIDTYEATRANPAHSDRDTIKWDRELDKYLRGGIAKAFGSSAIRPAAYRPFVKRSLYFDRHFNGMVYQLPTLFPANSNPTIGVLGVASNNPLAVLATSQIFDLCYLKAGNGGTQGLTRYRYTKSGERIDNITDWALNKFTAHYGKPAKITKDDIFAYVYAVLHDPVYRETYALNLKREFPRIPFYPGFPQWRDWGQRLLDLHIGYETVAPWPLTRRDVPDPRAKAAGMAPKPALKADKDAGIITLDSETTLSGIPPECWDYRLGNRSGLEWILDQYKEKTPKDPTIREKFNTYRFADYKEVVIDLLARVSRVSVETMEVVNAMKAVKRGD